MYFESIPLYFESILLYFATMLASCCTDNQYIKGKEKVVINIHFKDALWCWGYHLRLFFEETLSTLKLTQILSEFNLVLLGLLLLLLLLLLWSPFTAITAIIVLAVQHSTVRTEVPEATVAGFDGVIVPAANGHGDGHL